VRPPTLPNVLHRLLSIEGALTVYTIRRAAHGPHGALYALRVWRSGGGVLTADPEDLATGDWAAVLRPIPAECDWCLRRRHEDDDPSIMESWL